MEKLKNLHFIIIRCRHGEIHRNNILDSYQLPISFFEHKIRGKIIGYLLNVYLQSIVYQPSGGKCDPT